MANAETAARQQIEFHECASIFPMMSEAEYAGLVADIRENGQREDIVLFEGAILDGRNRYNACLDLGIEPRFTVFDDSRDTPQAFVISHNLHRRHLNESQRAMIAARIATRTKSEAALEATSLRTGRSENDNVYGIPNTKVPTVEQAAAMLNVNKGTVVDAKRILREATPEEVAAVDAGEVAVSGLADQLRANASPETRSAKRQNPNADRVTTMRANAQLWALFRDAVENLTALPHPDDMVRIVRANDKAKKMPAKMPIALKYLGDFVSAWNAD
jgi:hypothetical protein